MERIGIAASKIAQGNLFFYNLYVILLSVLFALFIFVIIGTTVLLALIIISYLGTELIGSEFADRWPSILTVCMVALSGIVGVFMTLAILRNIKLSKVDDNNFEING